MTFLASIGFARHLDREIVPGVAGGAGPPSIIQINAADTLVWPPGKDREFHLAHVGVARFRAGYLKLGAVTVKAGIGIGRGVGGLQDYLAVLENR